MSPPPSRRATPRRGSSRSSPPRHGRSSPRRSSPCLPHPDADGLLRQKDHRVRRMPPRANFSVFVAPAASRFAARRSKERRSIAPPSNREGAPRRCCSGSGSAAAVKRSAKRYRRAAIKRKAKNSPFTVHTNKVRATQLHVCVCYAVVVMLPSRAVDCCMVVAIPEKSPRDT